MGRILYRHEEQSPSRTFSGHACPGPHHDGRRRLRYSRKDDIVQRIKNVHLYPGHIACDPKANSELVLPIHHEGRVVAVLDMDSPLYDRFSEEDQKKMEDFVKVLEEITDFSSIEI